MSKKVDYRELQQLIADRENVRATAYYLNTRPRTRTIYDQAIAMGQDILDDRDDIKLAPQTMVDMAVQAINNALKAMKGNMTAADQHVSADQHPAVECARTASLEVTQVRRRTPVKESANSARSTTSHPSAVSKPSLGKKGASVPAATTTASEDKAGAPTPPPGEEIHGRSQAVKTAPTPDPSARSVGKPQVYSVVVPVTPSGVKAVKCPAIIHVETRRAPARGQRDKHLSLPAAIWRGLQWTLMVSRRSHNAEN